MVTRFLLGLFGLWLVVGFGATSRAGSLSPQPEPYRIGPNDVVRIQVYGEDDLTVERKVGGDGKIDYPLLGLIHVTGQTTEAVQADLTARLGAGYLKQPRVTVSITRHRNFYVSGEVKGAGGYPYEQGLTVQKAISMAGGFTERADAGADGQAPEARRRPARARPGRGLDRHRPAGHDRRRDPLRRNRRTDVTEHVRPREFCAAAPA